MADNVAITPGDGDVVGADDIGGVKYQRVKMIIGADGTNDGDVAAGNPLPTVLTAGTAGIGKLTANSGVDIGDVDVTSSALPTGASTADKQGIAGTDLVGGAGAVAAGVQRVTLASDDPAVTDLAAIEVLLGTIDADTGAIKTAVEIIDNAIDGTEMQVDVVASLPAGTNAIGKLAANSGVDIGDVDVLSLPSLPAGTNAIGKLAANSGVDIGDVDILSIAAGDNNIGNVDIASAIPAGTNIIGAVKRDTINYTPVRKYYANTGAATDGVVWSPVEGKKWVVTDIALTTSAAATVTLEDDLTAGDAVVMAFDLAANGGVSMNLQTPLVSGEADADLLITTSAGNIKIMVSGYEI
jgi:hypothetical protein